MRVTWTWLLWSLLVITAAAQPYAHQKLGGGFEAIGNGMLSSSGVPAWSASLPGFSTIFDLYLGTGNHNFSAAILGSGDREARPIALSSAGNLLWEGRGDNTDSFFDVFVDTDNLSDTILGGSRDAAGFGFAPNGSPIWYGYGSNTNGKSDIFVNTTNLSLNVLGSGDRDAYPVDVNSSGILVWDGYGTTTGGARDAFMTNLGSMASTNLSSGPLGSNRNALAVDVNEVGGIVWEGYGSLVGGWNDVFLFANSTTTNISRPVLGTGTHDASGVMANGNNRVVWNGMTTNYRHVYLDNVNVSLTPLGSGDRDAIGIAANDLSPTPHVLFDGISTNTSFYFDVFVNSTNVSRTTLGTTAQHDATGLFLDEAGNVIWLGKSVTVTNDLYNLFYNARSGNTNTNLTQAALGRNEETTVLAINSDGQILWAAPDATGNEMEVWLSTPRRATTLQGTINLDSFTGDPSQVALQIQLINPLTNAVVQTINTNLASDSTYNVAVNNPGYYALRYSAPRFLKRAFSERTILDQVVVDFDFINGDVTGDNVVDDADLAEVIFRFGESTTDPVDLTGDGVVDDADLAVVIFNFGTLGE